MILSPTKKKRFITLFKFGKPRLIKWKTVEFSSNNRKGHYGPVSQTYERRNISFDDGFLEQIIKGLQTVNIHLYIRVKLYCVSQTEFHRISNLNNCPTIICLNGFLFNALKS